MVFILFAVNLNFLKESPLFQKYFKRLNPLLQVYGKILRWAKMETLMKWNKISKKQTKEVNNKHHKIACNNMTDIWDSTSLLVNLIKYLQYLPQNIPLISFSTLVVLMEQPTFMFPFIYRHFVANMGTVIAGVVWTGPIISVLVQLNKLFS